MPLLPPLFEVITNPDSLPASAAAAAAELQPLAARCVARMAAVVGARALEPVVETLVPELRTGTEAARLGALVVVRGIVEQMGLALLPYAPMVAVPLVGCLGAHDPAARAHAAAFASLMPLLPLEAGAAAPADMSEAMAARRAAERAFIAQLVDGERPPRYAPPVAIAASLRDYQQEGVDWLAFLRRFGLGGILCDEMGLGKTLQTLCLLASAAHEQAGLPASHRLPSLVVCPTTLTAHWAAEATKFCAADFTVLEYVGPAAQRARLRPAIAAAHLVICSYETARSDAMALREQRWEYVVLDEGHVIKNGRSKTALALKGLGARHRLILSGTPLQNNVLELHGLFDFLIPGFLGTEAEFAAAYARPIHRARGAKADDAPTLPARRRSRPQAGAPLPAADQGAVPASCRRRSSRPPRRPPPAAAQSLRRVHALQQWRRRRRRRRAPRD